MPDGLSIIAAGDLNELMTPRLRLARPRFMTAASPDPEAGDWTEWQALLSDDTVPFGEPDEAALRFRTPRGFATVSSSLIALPAAPSPDRRTVFRHAGWLPEPSPWRNIEAG